MTNLASHLKPPEEVGVCNSGAQDAVQYCVGCGMVGCGMVGCGVWCSMVWCAVVCVVWCAEGAVTKGQKAGMSTHGYR